MIVIDEKFLVIKEINGYLVVMILINSFRSGHFYCTGATYPHKRGRRILNHRGPGAALKTYTLQFT
jgi:hypothetical protein